MVTLSAYPGEGLSDFLLRCLAAVKELHGAVSATHRDRTFVITSRMSISDVVRAWQDATPQY